ncbi:MAG: NYN domain-containing protein [Candidatus Dadabacteria bacterium]|nr:MAG: NYN domain-containing protein [Candidatus Dadabacteria bacterium]
MDEPSIAVFIDFENLALGVRDLPGNQKKFQIDLVLKRLLEKGRVVFKRAYSDWASYRDAVREFHAQGIELVDIPASKMSGKNSADIRMVVDAIDLCHTNRHITHFALISGDSDFSPLVSKLKEHNKRVIGCGIRSSTSQLLVSGCDEFIYYDDLVKPARKRKTRAKSDNGAKKGDAKKTADKKKAGEPDRDAELDKVVDIIDNLQADYDPLWGSLVKQTVRRVHPEFSEQQLGYRNFGELLKDLEKRGDVALEYDKQRGNFKVLATED